MASQLAFSHSFLHAHQLFFAAAPKPHHHRFHILHSRRLLAAICASSLNKTRVTGKKKTRTNADLCNDLREFMSEVGLPDGHVPSLKELSQHGRQDLANIVRRRGYKIIRELLAASKGTKVTDSDVERSLTGIQDKASTEEDESTGLDENVKELAEDVFLSNEDPVVGDKSKTKNFDNYTSSDIGSSFSIVGSVKASLEEKVVTFIQSGELEAIEDNGLDITHENIAEIEKEISEQNLTELDLSSAREEQSGQVVCAIDTADSLNGNISSSQLVRSTTEETSRKISSTDQVASAESADTDKDIDVETRANKDQAEVNRIKLMLHHKELELSHLKEQIERDKQALSELQAKAEAEISRTQKLLLDKDAELHAAEESLSGLKQVQIEYWGDGETVEVAGSFNGWHHGIKLDPQPSSNITGPGELRKSRLWKSVLWLYPGIYEIKFIVDGKWMIDPMKEVVTRGTIQNNILQVDR